VIVSRKRCPQSTVMVVAKALLLEAATAAVMVLRL
jgi:hypothetical protein